MRRSDPHGIVRMEAIRARIYERGMRSEAAETMHRNEEQEQEQQERQQEQGEQERQEQKGEKDHVPWSWLIRLLLCGTRDPSSSFYALSGLEDTVLRKIYAMVTESWKEAVTLTPPAYSVGRMYHFHNADAEDSDLELDYSRETPLRRDRIPMVNVSFSAPFQYEELGPYVQDRPRIAFSPCGEVDFPPPNDINVNMMPFTLGDKMSLPEDLQAYYPLVEKCPVILDEEKGKVCYLTVCEQHVEVDSTQRRGGLHIEAPRSETGSYFLAGREHHWGCGVAFAPDELHGGLYMASSLPDTCAVYNALVDDKTVVDPLGAMEHLRPYIGESTHLQANQLVWLTDCTPHEALPQKTSGYRQFFRLVTSNISLWYAEHSTPNPKVPLPESVQVIHGSKFQK